MPYVNIRIAGTLSREQRAKIAEEITDTLERIAHKPRSYTYIAFDELPDDRRWWIHTRASWALIVTPATPPCAAPSGIA
jgi:4-oxalocrotonate tautomerase